jgi:hypothetical protein
MSLREQLKTQISKLASSVLSEIIQSLKYEQNRYKINITVSPVMCAGNLLKHFMMHDKHFS